MSSSRIPERDPPGGRLIVFTRYPEPGRVKTRLIPALGPEGASGLHRKMAEYTLQRVREFRRGVPVSLEVRYDGGSQKRMEAWLGSDLLFSPQGSGDLGRRMESATRQAFRNGAKRVLIMGTDCPGIGSDHLGAAFEILDRKDLVLGPATDGGYYLIGLKRWMPWLFEEIPWGTGSVLAKTLDIARARGLRHEMLEVLADVDRPEDLAVWNHARDKASLPGISIIIPVINEEETIGQALESTHGATGAVEKIVVDGGSRDGTVRKALDHGARVIESVAGRSGQMNEGARAAGEDTLLFLHADTRLPPGYENHVHRILSPGQARVPAAGAFRLSIDDPFRGLRLIERLAHFRSVRMGMPYGDQAILLAKDTFFRVGGFPEISIMEDFELMRRLRRQGRIEIASAPVLTSARRYREVGFLWTTLVNQAIILAYLSGISTERLTNWYRKPCKPDRTPEKINGCESNRKGSVHASEKT